VDNPLQTDPDRDRRVRERAYHLWEADGKPHGHDVEYWERARELVAMEDSAGSGLLPNPQSRPESRPGSIPETETGTEDADTQEIPGELPDRFSEQTDVPLTPAARRSPARRRKAPAATPKRPKKP
jgi:hypothetical protein